MTTTESRAAFMAWHAKKHYPLANTAWMPDGSSNIPNVNMRWEIWQASQAAYQAGASREAGWISVDDRLPEAWDKPRQVLAIAKKAYPKECCYPGEGIRRVQQDWVIRQWPHNFTHWAEMPALPAPPLPAEGASTDA